MKTRTWFVIIALGAIIAAFFLIAHGITTESYSDRLVKAREYYDVSILLNPHSGPKKGLEVNGKKYYNPSGRPPFYISLAQLNCILFVTSDQKPPYTATFHIFNLNKSNEIQIRGLSYFGDTIGYSRTLLQDHVEVLSTNKLLISTKRPSRTDSQILDLELLTVSDYF